MHTPRDEKIMYSLGSYGVLSTEQIGKMHFENVALTTVRRRLGITSVKFHDLRATFITNLLARGESLARVMSIVGHELKTTNGYLRKAGVDVQGGTNKLGYKLPEETDFKILSLIKNEN